MRILVPTSGYKPSPLGPQCRNQKDLHSTRNLVTRGEITLRSTAPTGPKGLQTATRRSMPTPTFGGEVMPNIPIPEKSQN